MSQNRIVIVGGGHAAAQLCSSLVEAGAGPQVSLVCEESAYPYHRPPLSKTFLKSGEEEHQLHRDASWYPQHGVSVHLGEAASRIDRTSHVVELAYGEALPYDWLVLATGTRARKLPMLTGDFTNAAVLRDLADASALRTRLLTGRNGCITIVGGGFVGLEVAATARHLGWDVALFEAAPRLLSRSASPDLTRHIVEHHRATGCLVKVGASIDGVEAVGTCVRTLEIDGQPHPVDQLLVAIGATPEVSLAQSAGLEIANGIAVDEQMRSSDPRVLAIGDCSSFLWDGRRMRLESVQNANDQAKVAAATLLGKEMAYRPVPFFWSDQGALKLQMVGVWQEGLAAYRRAGSSDGSFSLFHYRGEHLVCVESANAPVDHIMARRLMERKLSPAPELVVNPQVQLKALL